MNYILVFFMFCGISWLCGLFIAPFMNGGIDVPDGKVQATLYLIMLGFLPAMVFVSLAS